MRTEPVPPLTTEVPVGPKKEEDASVRSEALSFGGADGCGLLRTCGVECVGAYGCCAWSGERDENELDGASESYSVAETGSPAALELVMGEPSAGGGGIRTTAGSSPFGGELIDGSTTDRWIPVGPDRADVASACDKREVGRIVANHGPSR